MKKVASLLGLIAIAMTVFYSLANHTFHRKA
jgi:hypothetical protein